MMLDKRYLLLTLPAVAAAVAAAGCFNPEYGATAFRCDNDNPCPPGYACRPAGGGVSRCERASPTADTGPETDGPRADRTPGTDGPLPTDSKVALEAAVRPDLPPAPDSAVGGPVVTLKTPADKHATGSYALTFSFDVSSPAGRSIDECSLTIDGKFALQSNKISLATTNSLSVRNSTLTVGVHTWRIGCTDSKKLTGYSVTRTLEHKPVLLSTCRASGFAASTRYKLSSDVSTSGTVCLGIDASGVIIDGAGKVIRRPATKDVLYAGHITDLTAATAKSGSWSSIWSVSLGNALVHPDLDAADFNGDDRLDVLYTATGASSHLYLAAKAASGSALPKTGSMTIPLGHNGHRVVDFNHDWAPDLVLAGNGYNEALYSGVKGSVPASKATTTFAWGLYTRQVDVGHLDEDHGVDLVMGSAQVKTYDARRYAGMWDAKTSSFSQVWTSGTTTGLGAGPAFVARIDNDSYWDLVVPVHRDINTSGSVPGTAIHVGAGKGQLKHSHTVPRTLPVAVRDMDGDGKMDLVLMELDAVYQPIAVSVFTGAGTKWTASGTASPKYNGGIAMAAVVELTGDKYPDVVTLGTGQSDVLKVFRNDLKASKPALTLTDTGSINGNGTSLSFRDMDNDGDLDILATHVSTGSSGGAALVLYENAGGGQVKSSAVKAFSAIQELYATAVGDLDGAPSCGVTFSKAAAGSVLSHLTIRGFGTGVDVQAAHAVVISGVTVEDPDLFGVRVDSATSVKVEKLALRHAVRGVGIGVRNAKVDLQSSSLCPAVHHDTLLFVGASCDTTAQVSGKGNQLSISNGCGTSIMSSPCL